MEWRGRKEVLLDSILKKRVGEKKKEAGDIDRYQMSIRFTTGLVPFLTPGGPGGSEGENGKLRETVRGGVRENELRAVMHGRGRPPRSKKRRGDKKKSVGSNQIYRVA